MMSQVVMIAMAVGYVRCLRSEVRMLRRNILPAAGLGNMLHKTWGDVHRAQLADWRAPSPRWFWVMAGLGVGIAATVWLASRPRLPAPLPAAGFGGPPSPPETLRDIGDVPFGLAKRLQVVATAPVRIWLGQVWVLLRETSLDGLVLSLGHWLWRIVSGCGRVAARIAGPGMALIRGFREELGLAQRFKDYAARIPPSRLTPETLFTTLLVMPTLEELLKRSTDFPVPVMSMVFGTVEWASRRFALAGVPALVMHFANGWLPLVPAWGLHVAFNAYVTVFDPSWPP